MTQDQLAYILERKFGNISIHHDVIISTHAFISGSSHQPDLMNTDVFIAEWRIEHIPKPSTEQLKEWWNILREQYMADPSRPDSDMFIYLKNKQTASKIIINELS